MVLGLTWVFISGLLWMLIGIVVSRITHAKLDFLAVAAVFGSLISVCAWLVFPDFSVLRSGETRRLGMLVWVMLASGFMAPLGMLSLQKGMRLGNHGVVWTIGQSALLIPFLFGVLIMHEAVTVRQMLGMTAILLAFFSFGRDKVLQETAGGNQSGLWFWMAILAFLLIGTQQTLATVPSHWVDWQDTANLRRPLLATGAGIGYVSLAIIKHRFPNRKEVLYGLIYASISLPSFYTIFKGMDLLKPYNMVSLVYPLAVGTCITGFVLYSLFVLREKISVAGISGLLFAGTGLVLISL